MNTIKWFYMLGTLLLLSLQVQAVEYVRPPSGPYQSSVIINKNQHQTGHPDEVYKFPSESLLHAENRDEPALLTGGRRNNESLPIKSKVGVAADTPEITKKSNLPAIGPAFNPADGNYSANPWAANNSFYPNPYQGNVYQGQGYYPQYSIPQQNPYGYNNQNNYMNNSVNSMPSPWSVMPMKPFFSGK